MDSSQLSNLARQMYPGPSGFARLTQIYRPYICPFDALIPWVPDQGSILDVGCGSGLFLGLALSLKPGITGIGFDANARAIDMAQAMCRSAFSDRRLIFELRSVDAPWPDGTFDAVSMIDVLHHIPPENQKKAVEKLFTALNVGGVLIYKDMGSEPKLYAWWNRLHDLLFARQWIHYRPIDAVQGWLRDCGASVVHRSDHRLGLYKHELIIAKKAE